MATGGQGDGDPSSSRSASLPNPPTTTSTTSIDINKNSTDNGNNYNNSNPPTATEDVAFTTTSSAPVRPSPPTLQLRRSSSGANARLVRRVTTQERLDGILEIGHQRALSMSPGHSPPVFRSPFRNGGGGLATPPTSGDVFHEHDDRPRPPGQDPSGGGGGGTPEPDERTGIVMKGPHHGSAPAAMNYQSMATSDTAGARARSIGTARKTTGNGNSNGHDENGHSNGDDYEHNKEADAWWKQQLAKFGSIELENKGSVARDHLALERTFLAWLRTSLSFASIGVAITQLFRLNTSLSDTEGTSNSSSANTLRHLGKPLGGVFLGISILILFLGYHRYFQAQQWIIKGKFPASRGTVILVSLVALGLMIVSLVVVLLVQPGGG